MPKNGARCCGNCSWNISDDDVEMILSENNYEKDDPDYPEAGCIFVLPDNKRWADGYYCREHRYIDGILYTYALYDERYLGPGYFIVSEWDDEIAMFAKIYQSKKGDSLCSMIAYEKGATDLETGVFRSINIPVSFYTSEVLYNATRGLAIALRNQRITAFNQSGQESGQLEVIDHEGEAVLSFSKGICVAEESSDFVDISMNGYMMPGHYGALNEFYNRLARDVGRNPERVDVVQKILKMTK